ncbi:MAG: hypothetical protein C4576_35610 [Desulfobacteraceae bacterium]|nr:MAG: hypothetical protein C4576_35610 [Desulfobacteraceae bacterium]
MISSLSVKAVFMDLPEGFFQINDNLYLRPPRSKGKAAESTELFGAARSFSRAPMSSQNLELESDLC